MLFGHFLNASKNSVQKEHSRSEKNEEKAYFPILSIYFLNNRIHRKRIFCSVKNYLSLLNHERGRDIKKKKHRSGSETNIKTKEIEFKSVINT